MASQKPGRASWADYARMLRHLHDTPATSLEMADATRLGIKSIRAILRRMRDLTLIHAPGAVKVGKHALPVWHFGAGESIDMRGLYPPLQPNVELITFAVILRSLKQQPQSAASLAAVAGINADRCRELLLCLHEELHMVCIVQWRKRRAKPGGSPLPMYSFGIDQPDVPRPTPMTQQAMWQRRNQVVAAHKRQAKRMSALCANASIFNLAQAA